MNLAGGVTNLIDRLTSYPLAEVITELVIIWLAVFAVIRFLQGTRAAGALKVILLAMVALTVLFRILGTATAFDRLEYVYDRLLALAAIALIVIFQPELRRGLIRLGEARLFGARRDTDAEAVRAIVTAAAYLAKQRMGALVVIERDGSIRGLADGGTELNAELSAPLLKTIFFPGSALHDLAVVVRGASIRAAGVQLPLADPAEMPDPTLGSRHRAAVGLTKECDAIAVVVSEETGHIRIAQRASLSRPYDAQELSSELLRRLRVPSRPEDQPPTDDQPRPDVSLSGEPPTEALDAARRVRGEARV